MHFFISFNLFTSHISIWNGTHWGLLQEAQLERNMCRTPIKARATEAAARPLEARFVQSRDKCMHRTWVQEVISFLLPCSWDTGFSLGSHCLQWVKVLVYTPGSHGLRFSFHSCRCGTCKLLAWATAITTPDQSSLLDWCHRIFNPLSEARDWTRILTDLNPLSHNSNSWIGLFPRILPLLLFFSQHVPRASGTKVLTHNGH